MKLRNIYNKLLNIIKNAPLGENSISLSGGYFCRHEITPRILTAEDYKNSLNEQISYKILCCEKEFRDLCHDKMVLKDSFGVMGYVVFERFKVDLVNRKKALLLLLELENSYN